MSYSCNLIRRDAAGGLFRIAREADSLRLT